MNALKTNCRKSIIHEGGLLKGFSHFELERAILRPYNFHLPCYVHIHACLVSLENRLKQRRQHKIPQATPNQTRKTSLGGGDVPDHLRRAWIDGHSSTSKSGLQQTSHADVVKILQLSSSNSKEVSKFKFVCGNCRRSLLRCIGKVCCKDRVPLTARRDKRAATLALPSIKGCSSRKVTRSGSGNSLFSSKLTCWLAVQRRLTRDRIS